MHVELTCTGYPKFASHAGHVQQIFKMSGEEPQIKSIKSPAKKSKCPTKLKKFSRSLYALLCVCKTNWSIYPVSPLPNPKRGHPKFSRVKSHIGQVKVTLKLTPAIDESFLIGHVKNNYSPSHVEHNKTVQTAHAHVITS